MRFYVNAWPTCGESLAGPFSTDDLPKSTEVESVTISTWKPSRLSKLASLIGSVFSEEGDSALWRDHAQWIQPGR